MEYVIEVFVKSKKGECAFGHKVGDRILFDGRRVKGEICLSALYSMLPKVYAMAYGAQFPWLENKDVATHACPDAYNPVVFEIKRRK
ncbi:MAG: TIGR04076 family protein [Candidatus Methanofastidiosia archaeon]